MDLWPNQLNILHFERYYLLITVVIVISCSSGGSYLRRLEVLCILSSKLAGTLVLTVSHITVLSLDTVWA